MRCPRVIAANFYIITKNGGDICYTFYGLGVISLFNGAIDGSVDGQYCEGGLYKRIGRTEQKLKIFFSPASGHVRKYLYLNFDVAMNHSLVVKRYAALFSAAVSDSTSSRKPKLRALSVVCSEHSVAQKLVIRDFWRHPFLVTIYFSQQHLW